MEPDLTRFEYGIIHRKTQQLINQGDFHWQDRDFIQQELTSRLLQGLQSFDPDLGVHRNSFATTIIERSVATLIRRQRTHRQRTQGSVSLNVRIDSEQGRQELGTMLSQQEYDNRRGRQYRSAQDAIDLNSDVESCVASLPDELRDLAEELKHKTLTQIASDRNLPRTTLRHSLLKLREHFEKRGMQFHL